MAAIELKSIRSKHKYSCVEYLILLFSPIAIMTSAIASPKMEDGAVLSQIEAAIYGHSFSNSGKSIEARVTTIEKTVFGRKKSGAISQRLGAIVKVVPLQKSTVLMPPLAPSRDNFVGSVENINKQVEQGRVQITDIRQEEINRHLQAGMRKYSQGDLLGAEVEFQHVLELDQKNPHAFFNLGVIAESRGNLNLALQNYRTALVFDPGAADLQRAVVETEQRLSRQQASFAQSRDFGRLCGSVQEKQAHQSVFSVPPSMQSEMQLPVVSVTQNSKVPSKAIGKAAFTAARIVGIGALSAVAGRAGGLDIGCPLCRLLRGGF